MNTIPSAGVLVIVLKSALQVFGTVFHMCSLELRSEYSED